MPYKDVIKLVDHDRMELFVVSVSAFIGNTSIIPCVGRQVDSLSNIRLEGERVPSAFFAAHALPDTWASLLAFIVELHELGGGHLCGI